MKIASIVLAAAIALGSSVIAHSHDIGRHCLERDHRFESGIIEYEQICRAVDMVVRKEWSCTRVSEISRANDGTSGFYMDCDYYRFQYYFSNNDLNHAVIEIIKPL